MSAYQWGRASFAVPTDLEDESVLSFVKYIEQRPVSSLTITTDAFEGSLQEFVDATSKEVAETFPGWLEAVAEQTKDLIVTTHMGVSLDGEQCVARAFRKIDDRVYCFTAMGTKAMTDELIGWVREGAKSCKHG